MGGNWGWEMAAVLLSCCSLVATITVLKLYDGTNVNSWKFYLSLSTIISILSQLSRTSMAFALTSCIGQAKWNWFSKRENRLATFSRFDAASRGPLGSVALLWQFGFSHWIALGALTTIALLGYDPVLQAMVTRSGGNEPISDTEMGSSRTSRLPIAESAYFGLMAIPSLDRHIFLTSANGSRGNDINVTEYQVRVADGWSRAVFEGFAHKYDGNQKVYAPTSFTCASANCTYGVFDSLAVCSECHNISEHIISEPYSDDISAEQVLYGLGRKTPGIEAIWLNNPKGKLVRERLSSYYDIVSLTAGKVIVDRRETFHLRDAFTTFIVFQILRAPKNYTLQVSAWEDELPEALECGFSFCLNRYNSTVQDGILYETVLHSTKQTSPESMRAYPHLNGNRMRNITNGTEQWYFWSYPSNYSLYSPLGDELSPNITLPDPSKLWDFIRSSLDLQMPDSWGPSRIAGNSSHHPYGNDSRTFSISDATVRSTIYWFLAKYRMFVGSALRLAYNDLTSYNDNDVVGKSIAKSTNITETFENAAKRMTAFMREVPQTADNEQVYVNGQAFVWVEHIRIRWPFATFPVAVAVVGLVFVLLTTWETKRLGLRAWKEGALPVLIHGLDPSTRTKLRNADSAGVADKISKQTVVTLSRDSVDGSFELKESKESASSTGALLERYASSSETLTKRHRDEREGM